MVSNTILFIISFELLSLCVEQIRLETMICDCLLSEPLWSIEARNAAIANSFFTCAINRVGTVSTDTVWPNYLYSIHMSGMENRLTWAHSTQPWKHKEKNCTCLSMYVMFEFYFESMFIVWFLCFWMDLYLMMPDTILKIWFIKVQYYVIRVLFQIPSTCFSIHLPILKKIILVYILLIDNW